MCMMSSDQRSQLPIFVLAGLLAPEITEILVYLVVRKNIAYD